MEENLVEQYYDRLEQSKVASHALVPFYVSLFSLDMDLLDNQKLHVQFNKLVKMYGKLNVFLSLLDMADMENINHDNIYRLVSYLCKRRLMDKLKGNPNKVEDLSDLIERLESKRTRRTNLDEFFD